ncbi:MAG: folK [Paucimonas sp.]|nr:folK [Paucimonas sp.]
MSNTPALAWIGIGANLGDAPTTVEQAIARLAGSPGCSLQARSSLYRTAPVAAVGDDYVNAVARLATTLSPAQLLQQLMQIESEFGRQRDYRNAPRTLDLDLLLYDQVTMDTAQLILPHPRMHERAFVLVPLLEIDPAITIPGRGSAAALLPATAGQAIQKIEAGAAPAKPPLQSPQLPPAG